MTDEDQVTCMDGPSAECSGDVDYRYPLSGTGISYPRCDLHWDARVKYQHELEMRYPRNAPSDFDPMYAGEVWEEY